VERMNDIIFDLTKKKKIYRLLVHIFLICLWIFGFIFNMFFYYLIPPMPNFSYLFSVPLLYGLIKEIINISRQYKKERGEKNK